MGGIGSWRDRRVHVGRAVGAGFLLCVACIGSTESRISETKTASRNDVLSVQPRPTVPYSLTISGGLSLGAYEAGMNWALIEWMRSRRLHAAPADPERAVPELVGVTGASAGAINALFSAIRWCEGSGPVSSVEENIFATSWLRIGFEEMLPNDPSRYASLRDRDWDPDFLISRKHAFHDVIRDLRRRIGSSAFRPDCKVPVSFIVTKILPGRIQVDSLRARTQRYVIALVAETVKTAKGYGLRFALNRALAKTSAQQLVGNILWLSPESRPEGTWEVAPDLVLDALQASSAHPTSFGPVVLRHCAPSSSCRPSDRHESQTCREVGRRLEVEEPFTECAEPFNDGGAFDNVPLGVAVAQAEREPEGEPRFPPRYIYMDPNNRRTGIANPGDTCVGDTGAMSGLAGRNPTRELSQFIGGFLDAAFEYELQGVLRYLEWNRTLASLVDQTYRSIALRARPGKELDQDKEHRRKEAVEIDRLTGVGRLDQWQKRRRQLIEDLLADLSGGFGCRADLPTGPASCRREISRSTSREDVEVAGELENARNRLFAWRDSGRSGRRLQIPQRLPPIAGAMLGHFAAWVDRPFRDYDYYAGIHDGLAAIADWECEECPDDERRTIIGRLIRELGFEGSNGSKFANDANEIVTALLELDGSVRARKSPRFEGRPSNVGRLLAALTSPDRCARGGTCMLDCPFETFVQELSDAGYQPATPLGKEILSRGANWWTPVAVRLADRLESLEEDHKRADEHFAGTLSWTRRVGSLATYHWYYQSRNSWFEPPSSARPDLLRLLFPYLTVSGSMERKFDLGLVAYGACSGRWCIVTDVSVRSGWLPGVEKDAPNGPFDPDRAHWSLDVHAGPRIRMQNVWLSSIQLRGGWTPPGASIGVDLPHRANLELDLGFVFDRFRLGVGCNALGDDDIGCLRNPYIVLGLTDLSGWATHIW